MLTASEVNARLPLVRSILRDALELYVDLQWRAERLRSLRERYPVSEDDPVYEPEVEQSERELQRDQQRFDGLLAELAQIGGVLTDPVKGLVDFAGLLDGRRVVYCWQKDEPAVSHWHSGPCSMATRKPLWPAAAVSG
ncbi:MAG: hypothetical protein RL215_2399 [Planctomycetota bacterium]|jgi:hypothetical protein